MPRLLSSKSLHLALAIPAIAALLVSTAILWFLLGTLLQQSAARQLLNTLPIVGDSITGRLSLNATELHELIHDLTAGTAVRVTLIRADGVVVADSSRSWEQMLRMDNHAGRPEISAALEEGQGWSVRRSDTTGLDYVYAARVLDSDEGRFVLRLAQPLTGLQALHRSLGWVLIIASIGALLAVGLLLWWFELRLSKVLPQLLSGAERLVEGDFSHRVDLPPEPELARIGRFLNRVSEQAESRIQDLETARTQLTAVISGMGEGVLVTDSEGFVWLANQAFREIFDIQAAAIGRSPLELTRQTQLEDLIVTTLVKGMPSSAELQLPGQPARHVALASTPLGEGLGTVVVARDITDLVRLTQVRRDFIANISHELKTPLSAIRGYTETLRDGAVEEPEASHRFLGRILQQCSRLQTLLEDLLTLSRLENLEGHLERRTVDLERILDDCLETLAPQISDKQIHLEVQEAPVPKLSGDAEALQRLFINLLENAIKYNRKGGHVTVQLRPEDGKVVFQVDDTGIGIPAASIDRVFERFYRVDKGRSRDEGGTGLGLAIVKHVAQLHGGRVEVDSHLGEGSSFRVHLPVGPQPAPASI
jgi:two-component system phosphate regulon sensor histidine kinase PhoR